MRSISPMTWRPVGSQSTNARMFYAQSMMAMMKENKKHEYLQGFQFQVATGNQGDADKPAAMAMTGKDKK